MTMWIWWIPPYRCVYLVRLFEIPMLNCVQVHLRPTHSFFLQFETHATYHCIGVQADNTGQVAIGNALQACIGIPNPPASQILSFANLVEPTWILTDPALNG